MRGLTMLNEQGDVTIVWDEADDDRMEAIIAKKMEQGIQFFVIEPRLGGLAQPAKRPLRSADSARDHRALSIRDEDLAAFVGESDTAAVVKTPPKPVRSVRKAKTAKEVAKGESVGVRPMRGG
jgi:hypothetical protein